MTDATGTTTYGYDANGDVTSQALVATGGLSNETTSYTYYTTGALDTVVYPSYSGHSDPSVTYTYDQDGQMASSTDWLGNEVSFAHDTDNNTTAQDNDVSTSNPSGTSNTAFAYDNADLLSSTTTTLAQSCGGSETLTQSFSGSSGSRNADAQVTSDSNTYSGSCSGQTNSTYHYSYDTAGNVTYEGTSAQGSSPSTFGYDPSGDPTTFSSERAGTTDTYTQAFDSAGEVTSQTPVSGSGGTTSAYSYDTLGDQTATSGSANAISTYNAAGQLASFTSGNTSTAYTENGEGLVSATSSTTTNSPTWASPSDVDSTDKLNAISCVSASFCAAADDAGDVLTYNGTTWTSPSHVDGSNDLDAISCASSTFCVAVDTSGNAAVYSGSPPAWSSASDVDGSRSIDAISCPTTTFCAAVDASGHTLTDTSGAWLHPDNDGSNDLDAISCASSTFCVAVDTSGNAIVWNGSWGTASDVDGSRSIDAINCPTITFCAGADASGHTLTDSSGTWLHPDTDSSNDLDAVSCATSTFCVAVDTSGNAVVWNNGSWSTPSDVDSTRGLRAVSCASGSYFCGAVDNSGYAVTYDGGNWSASSDIDSTHILHAVSCPSTTLCAAVDGSGRVVVATATTSTTTSQLTWDNTDALAAASPVDSLPAVLSDGTDDYVYGPTGTPVEAVVLSTSTPTYLTYDPSNNSWTVANQSGDLSGFWGYDAYGSPLFGTAQSPFGYAGQYTDPATGFGDDRARLYEPTTGTYTTRDPAFAATDTAYTYANGDPVDGSDPTGLCSDGPTFLVPGPCHWSSSTWVNSAQSQIRSQYAGGGFSIIRGVEGVTDFYESAANTVVSGATLGHVHIPISFPCIGGWVTEAGELYAFVGLGLLGVGELDAPAALEGASDVSDIGVSVATGDGASSAPASLVRMVAGDESQADIFNELKALTFETGNEHALVTLSSGEQAIVSGGEQGIYDMDIENLVAHTHPYQLPAQGVSDVDYGALHQLGQESSILLEHGQEISFGVNDPQYLKLFGDM